MSVIIIVKGFVDDKDTFRCNVMVSSPDVIFKSDCVMLVG
jgi:hypothetical protein